MLSLYVGAASPSFISLQTLESVHFVRRVCIFRTDLPLRAAPLPICWELSCLTEMLISHCGFCWTQLFLLKASTCARRPYNLSYLPQVMFFLYKNAKLVEFPGSLVGIVRWSAKSKLAFHLQHVRLIRGNLARVFPLDVKLATATSLEGWIPGCLHFS